MDNLIQFVRYGAIPDGRKAAWDTLIAPIKAPLAVPPGAPPNYAARVSAVARSAPSRLFLPLDRPPPFPGHPPLPATRSPRSCPP